MTERLPMSFGYRLKAARARAGLLQKELAEKSTINYSVLRHYEIDDKMPKLDNLYKLCEALNVSADFLIGRKDEM